ncbi:MAG: LysM peptidoglycan-binding domain-containing protein [Planctomycetaceae bacterium]|nr:LysM peptidoglycan-binding domain-containing protein [Planctomycetaceae bacterium]
MKWEPQYTDITVLLIREGIKACDVAATFSSDSATVSKLLQTLGLSVMKLKNMPPMPQEQRRKIINDFCEKPVHKKRLCSILDLYNMRFEDFIAQPNVRISKHPKSVNNYPDFVIMLIRDGVGVRHVAEILSVNAGDIRKFVLSRGFSVMALRNMPTVPQADRHRLIQEFCTIKPNAKRVIAFLKHYNIELEGLLALPFRKHLESVHGSTMYNRRALDARNTEMFELRRKGDTLESIAQRYGITRERVRQIIKRRNKTSDNPIDIQAINMRNRRLPSPEIMQLRKQIVELCRVGKTARQIADSLNVEKRYIYECVRKHNKAVKPSLRIPLPD